MKLKKLHLLFIASAITVGFSSFAQTPNGKLVLNKGQRIQVDNSVKSVTNMDMMGQSMEMTSDVSMLNQVEVIDKVNDAYTVTNTLTKLLTSGSGMGQDFKFDSEKKEDLESEIGNAMKGQLNVTKQMEFKTDGTLASIKKDVATEAANSNPMMDMMKNMGGGADETGGTSDIFQVLPSGKNVGDSWSDSTIAEGLKTYRTYLLKELKGNDAILALMGSQSTKKSIEQQGMQVAVELESKFSGEVTIDVLTGLVKQKSLVTDGKGTVEAGGQEIPITTKITSTTVVKSL